jgi:hypothetical protein
MLSLNKRHGASTTNEILTQIIQAISDEEAAKLLSNFKPEYSDVVCDDELSNPPIEPVVIVERKKTESLKPVPNWFSFDQVSELERDHFGPLFSMDEERWKMYLSLRNDVVRIYEEQIAQTASKGEVYLSASDLRQRLHPKDDAAYIFEMWKFLTSISVINRGRVPENKIESTKVVPSKKPRPSIVTGTYTKINCSTCGRECKFFCYKPLPPPPETPEGLLAEEAGNPPPLLPTTDEPKDDQQVKEEEMQEAETYMCHDCTPAFFEKIPLRLFIDEDTRDRIIHGEFEEVTKDDLKSFLVVPKKADNKTEPVPESTPTDSLLDRLVTKKLQIVKSWDVYQTAENGSNSVAVNPLEILDPSMQEALSGAGQKIRGSVLIEQQVRNMVYGSSLQNEDVEPVCPTTIDRAYALVEEVFKRVATRMNQPLPQSVGNSHLMTLAKKTDSVHFELLSVVYRTAVIARELKEELLTRVDVARIENLARERLDVKKQFLAHLRTLGTDESMETSDISIVDLFKPVSGNVPFASTSPKQLRLASL